MAYTKMSSASAAGAAAPSGRRRAAGIAVVFIAAALLLAGTAFATGTTDAIQGGIKSGTLQLYNIMTAIVVPLAAVFFAWNAFKALFGGERGMETAKRNMLTVVIVLALVWLAPVIIEQVSGWFESSSSTAIFQ